MNTTTQQQIAEYYAKLPPNVQNVFSSMTWTEELQKISDIYKLSDAQKETLATETTLVFLGMIHTEDYEKNLTLELGLARDSVEKMIVDINIAIFKPIKMDLIKTYTTNATTLADETYGGGKKLDERFAKLPPEVQNAIGSLDYERAIVAIGKQFNLTVVQVGIFEATTTKVMLGVIHPNEYRSALMAGLNLPKEKIDEIVTAANTQIFLEIRESFMKMFDNDLDTPEKSKSTENIGGRVAETSTAPEKVVSQEETEHSNLDRNDLLSQIENPVPLGGTPLKVAPADDINNHTPEVASLSPLSKGEWPKAEGVLDSNETKSNIVTSSSSTDDTPSQKGRGDSVASAITSLPKAMEAMKQTERSEQQPTESPVASPEEVKKIVTAGIPDFLKNKLGMNTSSEPTTTDHSLPKIGGAPPTNLPVKPIDPYHEAIE